MDFGKYKYEQDQRRKESRRKASNVVIKEMKFRPKIDAHDYDTKMKHVERFLEEGSKVKLTIMFRGREMAHPELGRRILEKVAERVAEIAIVESAPEAGRPQHDDGAQPHSQAQGEAQSGPTDAGHDRLNRTRKTEVMPKMKTHRGAAKRFKVTGTGKILRRQAYRDHLLENKPSHRTRRLGREAEVDGGDSKHVKRLLGR